MSILSLVLKLWQFSFIRDWTEIQKLEIPPPEFYPISGDWGELGVPNLVCMSLMKCYWIMWNAKVIAFKREPTGGRGKITPQISLRLLILIGESPELWKKKHEKFFKFIKLCKRISLTFKKVRESFSGFFKHLKY